MRELRFYRPNKSGNGAAIALQLSYKKDNEFDKYQLFLIGANQLKDNDSNGNAQFDWKSPITVKLGENDLGEILSVLEGRKDFVGPKGSLFHQTPGGGSKVVGFSMSENGYSLSLSAQDKDKNIKKVFMNLSHAEASVMCVLIKRGIEKMFMW